MAVNQLGINLLEVPVLINNGSFFLHFFFRRINLLSIKFSKNKVLTTYSLIKNKNEVFILITLNREYRYLMLFPQKYLKLFVHINEWKIENSFVNGLKSLKNFKIFKS